MWSSGDLQTYTTAAGWGLPRRRPFLVVSSAT